MPQIFQVLRCYKCFVFQIHQTKKSSKFECKLCGEKQSIKRHYGIGTAKDCRHHVQRLNMIRGEQNEITLKNNDSSSCSSSDDDTNDTENKNVKKLPIFKTQKQSKWSNFVQEEEKSPELSNNSEEPMFLNDTEVVLEIPKKNVKKFKAPLSSKNLNSSSSASWPSIDNNTSTFHSSNNPMNKSLVSSVNLKIPKFKDVEPSVSASVDTAPNHQPSACNNDKSNALKKMRKSKWAQFAPPMKRGDSDTVTQIPESNSDPIPHAQDMFALCNDEDLDNVLFMY